MQSIIAMIKFEAIVVFGLMVLFIIAKFISDNDFKSKGPIVVDTKLFIILGAIVIAAILVWLLIKILGGIRL